MEKATVVFVLGAPGVSYARRICSNQVWCSPLSILLTLANASNSFSFTRPERVGRKGDAMLEYIGKVSWMAASINWGLAAG